MTQEELKQCRAEFEAWIKTCFLHPHPSLDIDPHGYYSDQYTRISWTAWQAAWNHRTPQAQLTDDHIRDATKLILTESEIDLLHDKHMFEAMDGYCMLDYQGFAKAIAARCGDEQLRQQRDELLSAMKDVVSAWTEQKREG